MIEEDRYNQTSEESKLATKWVGKNCTLNGRRANIVGGHLRFALVRIHDFEKPQYDTEYSWQAVERVMSADKAFKS